MKLYRYTTEITKSLIFYENDWNNSLYPHTLIDLQILSETEEIKIISGIMGEIEYK